MWLLNTITTITCGIKTSHIGALHAMNFVLRKGSASFLCHLEIFKGLDRSESVK
jgi:hypothetical protein